MNSKSAIQNVANVPNKFDKSGGTITGSIIPNKHISYNLGQASTAFNNVYCSNFISSDPQNYSYNGTIKYETTQKHQSGAWILDNHAGSITLGESGTDIVGSINNGLTYNGNAVYHAGNKPPSLSTARKITLTGSVTGNVAFDGSKDVSITTTTNHTHDYLPLTGGTVNGTINATHINITNNNGYKNNNLNAGDNHVIGVSSGIVYLGNPQAKTQIEANSNPTVLVNGSKHTMYHTGNKPTPSEIGAIPNSKMTVSKTAPSKPSTGDLWISW